MACNLIDIIVQDDHSKCLWLLANDTEHDVHKLCMISSHVSLAHGGAFNIGHIPVERLYEVVALSFLKLAQKVNMTVIPTDPSPDQQKLIELRIFILGSLNSSLESIISGVPTEDSQGLMRKVPLVAGKKREEMIQYFFRVGFAEVS